MAQDSASPVLTQDASVLAAGTSSAPERLWFTKELLAGLVLVFMGGFAMYAGRDLDPGTLRAVGPGALPHALAYIVLAAGVLFTVAALVRGGQALGRWPLRGPIFVALGLIAFALTIRTLGLAVAGPAVILISGASTSETRPLELVIFAGILTAGCIGLFRFALGLPIPVLIIPGVVTI